MSEGKGGGGVVDLVPTKPDADIGADLKKRMDEALKPVLALMDEAVRSGLVIQFDGIVFMGPPQLRHQINNLRIVKVVAS